MDAASLAALLTGAAALAAGTGLSYRSRPQREAVRAETASTYASAAAEYSTAAATMVPVLQTQIDAVRAQLRDAERDIGALRQSLAETTAAGERARQATVTLRQSSEIAQQLAVLEIARLRNQLDAQHAECRQEITLIRSENEAEIGELRLAVERLG